MLNVSSYFCVFVISSVSLSSQQLFPRAFPLSLSSWYLCLDISVISYPPSQGGRELRTEFVGRRGFLHQGVLFGLAVCVGGMDGNVNQLYSMWYLLKEIHRKESVFLFWKSEIPWKLKVFCARFVCRKKTSLGYLEQIRCKIVSVFSFFGGGALSFFENWNVLMFLDVVCSWRVAMKTRNMLYIQIDIWNCNISQITFCRSECGYVGGWWRLWSSK